MAGMAAAAAGGAGGAGGVDETADDAFTAYLAWCEEQGVVVHAPLSVRRTAVGEERGVYLREQEEEGAGIEADSLVISIPFGVLMTYENLASTPLVAFTREAPLREDDALALLLLFEKHERGADSRWAPHIALLPETYHNVLYFSDDQIARLEGNLGTLAGHWKGQVQNDFEQLAARTASGSTFADAYQWFTLENYRWALCSIWSRFVSISRAGKNYKAMAPLFDMFNHDPRAQTAHGLQPSNDCLHIVTFQKIEPGKEIFINYGPLSNAQLLTHYGFVLEDNPFDTVEIWATMEQNAPDFQIKDQVLKQYGILHDQKPFPVRTSALPTDLIKALRVQRAEPSEFSLLHRAIEDNVPLSDTNETAVILALQGALESCLEAYSTTLEQDEDTLHQAKQDGTVHNPEAHSTQSLLLRIAEKRLYKGTLRLLSQYADRVMQRFQLANAALEGHVGALLITPAAFQRELVGEIMQRCEQRGLASICTQMCNPKAQALTDDVQRLFEASAISSEATLEELHSGNGPFVLTLWHGKDASLFCESIRARILDNHIPGDAATRIPVLGVSAAGPAPAQLKTEDGVADDTDAVRTAREQLASLMRTDLFNALEPPLGNTDVQEDNNPPVPPS